MRNTLEACDGELNLKGPRATPKRFFRYLGDMAELLEQIMKLSESERLELAYSIIRLSHEQHEDYPLTPGQIAELDRRMEEHRQNPESGIPWEEVKARLKK
jgi:putative addiction module component (TIGR02574 family)